MFRFLRHQTPLTIFVEVLFALLLVMIFLASQEGGFRLTAPRKNDDVPTSSSSPTPVAFAVAITVPTPVPTPVEDTAPTPRLEPSAIDDDDLLRDLDCRDLVVNGDFETLEGWQMPVTARPASLTNEQVYTGDRSLKLGLIDADQHLAGESIAAQSIDLPGDASAVLLRAQLWQGSDGDATDSQYLLIESDELSRIAFEERADSRAWHSFAYDLTSLRGQSVRLLFGVDNDGENGRAVLYVDDLRVLACTPN